MSRTMYDSTNPNDIPTNAQMVAGYIDGTTYKWSENSWSRFPTAVKVRIARRTYTNDGHVLDVEAGIPTVWPINGSIVTWVQMRRNAGVEPTIYCNQLNDWSPLRTLFNRAGVKEPNWWVARYNNDPVIPPGAIAKQYANPPLAGGHYDLSVVADYWPGVDGGNDVTPQELQDVAAAVWNYHINFQSQPQNPGGPAWMHLSNGNLAAQQANVKLDDLTDDEATILAAIRGVGTPDVQAFATALAPALAPLMDAGLTEDEVVDAVRTVFRDAGVASDTAGREADE